MFVKKIFGTFGCIASVISVAQISAMELKYSGKDSDNFPTNSIVQEIYDSPITKDNELLGEIRGQLPAHVFWKLSEDGSTTLKGFFIKNPLKKITREDYYVFYHTQSQPFSIGDTIYWQPDIGFLFDIQAIRHELNVRNYIKTELFPLSVPAVIAYSVGIIDDRTDLDDDSEESNNAEDGDQKRRNLLELMIQTKPENNGIKIVTPQNKKYTRIAHVLHISEGSKQSTLSDNDLEKITKSICRDS